MNYSELWLADWKSLEDQWPPDPEMQVIFYNNHLDVYLVSSSDELERAFKRYQDYSDEFSSLAPDDEQIQNWVKMRYRFTHWDFLPIPPT